MTALAEKKHSDNICEHGHCHDHEHGHCHDHEHGHCHDHEDGGHEPAQGLDPAIVNQASATRAIYRVANMDCPMEEALIRKKLATVPEVVGLQFNLMQRVLIVDHKGGSTEPIERALVAIDMIPEKLQSASESASLDNGPDVPWKKLIFAGVIAAFSELVELATAWNFGGAFLQAQIGGFAWGEIIALFLALWAIALSGLGTYKKGWLAISNFNLNINALMAVAVTGAVLIGQFPEAAMVMVLFNVSEAIEAMALDRARNAIKDLMALAPETATIKMPDGSWQEVELKDVPLHSICRIRPGQKIGLDGEVISGHSEVDQAPITGESMPVEKGPGDLVYAGTINESGSFEYRVTSMADNSTLARIIHAVEEAQATRAPMQRFVDIFAKYYTPAIFLFAVLWALTAPLLFQASWYESIYTALVILVIGCPCALVISTPVTVVSGMAAATAKGILIKGGLYLELGRRLVWLALDKTGTLTYGKPRVTQFVNLGQLSDQQAQSIARSLAARSDHPVSKAIAAEAEQKDLQDVEDFKAQPGKGVSGKINGHEWKLGKPEAAKVGPQVQKEIQTLESQGNTVVAVGDSAGAVALFAVADALRETSVSAIAELNKLNVKTMMLTGDNAYTAKAIAKEAGVNEVRANLLPGDKLEIIASLEEQGNITGMVGDGINDAPALARANIGFAMAGGGTDTAIETADVALMDDDLRKIPAFIKLSRATFAVLVQNIALALGIKAVFFALTLTGNATMWMAVFADVGAALLVVANGLRVRTK